ncbi:MAG: type I-U CRISPR-associated protein Cas5/Cas6 [Myxococcaceae bacterium]|nr:type I-U CRISPR-associated protein Cas5/Cas6 [Myxococcaceae bacterium]
MTLLEIRFLAGRYHATPWGRHVNEGAIEWPPSPWRLCRALLAAGFNRCGWAEVPPVGRALLEKLAAAPPRYHLPPASTGHTRHYLPKFDGKTTKVLDAFAQVGRGDDACLGVEFPVALAAEETALLDELVSAVGYLGRAESWAEVRRVAALPQGGLEACELSEHPPGLGYERFPLLAPIPAADYARWRQESLERERARRLRQEQHDAEQKRKPPPSALTKRQEAQVLALFPEELVDALRVDTRWLQQVGWSQPPGSRWLSYWRPEDALSHQLPSPPRREVTRFADTALLALTSKTKRRDVLPPLVDAVLRMDQLHQALVGKSDLEAGEGPSPCFTARAETGEPLRGHRHAALMPLDLDGDQRMDHVLIHAPMGFDMRARHALERVSALYAAGLPSVLVTLLEVGRREDFSAAVPQTSAARRWVSATPFLAPRHFKRQGRNSLEGQVRAELVERGFPEPVAVEFEVEPKDYAPAEALGGVLHLSSASVRLVKGEEGSRGQVLARRWRHFRRERPGEARRPPSQPALGLRLTFAEDVRGPLCLGYGSHFGLGQFIPEASR